MITGTAAEEIIGELQALFVRHNTGAALSAKAIFKLTKGFHTARHMLYSADENMEIDKVVWAAASVKTKLGKGYNYPVFRRFCSVLPVISVVVMDER